MLALAPTALRRWVETGVFGETPDDEGSGAARGGYASPDDTELVDEIGMEVALDEVRRAYPNETVTRMPHNNPGFDIRVGPEARPVRYVEVKSTRSPEPIFIISEGERDFSTVHATQFSLLIITGIDSETRTYQSTSWYQGEVDREGFGLRPLQWRGQGPA